VAASELDRKFDATLAAVTGPGGRLVIGKDEQGRAIVANFPATLPTLLRTFCALNADTDALVAANERFTFAQLDQWSERVARSLAGRGIRKGDRVAIAMRNCPSWIIAYMAALKAGAVATLLNGWWQTDELRHALEIAGHCRPAAGRSNRCRRHWCAGLHDRGRSAARSRAEAAAGGR
jgi:long-chain acyl-CoA synthetase